MSPDQALRPSVEPASNDPDPLDLLLRRSLASVQAGLDRRLPAEGLTPAYWHPLVTMLRHAGPITAGELARRLPMDAGAVTRLIDRLERKALCRRLPHPVDRRAVQVDLSGAGLAAASTATQVLDDVVSGHLAGFSDEEVATLRGLLTRWVANGGVSWPTAAHRRGSGELPGRPGDRASPESADV